MERSGTARADLGSSRTWLIHASVVQPGKRNFAGRDWPVILGADHGERPEFASQTALQLANLPELPGFLSPGKPGRFAGTGWWAMQGSNLRPLPCEGSGPTGIIGFHAELAPLLWLFRSPSGLHVGSGAPESTPYQVGATTAPRSPSGCWTASTSPRFLRSTRPSSRNSRPPRPPRPCPSKISGRRRLLAFPPFRPAALSRTPQRLGRASCHVWQKPACIAVLD